MARKRHVEFSGPRLRVTPWQSGGRCGRTVCYRFCTDSSIHTRAVAVPVAPRALISQQPAFGKLRVVGSGPGSPSAVGFEEPLPLREPRTSVTITAGAAGAAVQIGSFMKLASPAYPTARDPPRPAGGHEEPCITRSDCRPEACRDGRRGLRGKRTIVAMESNENASTCRRHAAPMHERRSGGGR